MNTTAPLTRRMRQVLEALKANHQFRLLRPDGTRWCVYDTSTKTAVLANISNETVHRLFYAGVGIVQDGEEPLLVYHPKHARGEA
jgi:hypothetical protein